MFKIF